MSEDLDDWTFGAVMYDRYYSTCHGAAYKRGWSEDDRDERLCFIKKNIAVNHHSILFKVTEERNSFFILALAENLNMSTHWVFRASHLASFFFN